MNAYVFAACSLSGGLHLTCQCYMLSQTHQLESHQRNGLRLIAIMRFEADRFVTDFQLATEAETWSLFSSVEGATSDIWPPSGPLQEILAHEDGKKQCLAGVGRGGKSHWSTVLSTDLDSPSPSIDFDFACRVKDEPEFLGSTYRLSDEVSEVVKEGNVLRIQSRDQMIGCSASRGVVDCTGSEKLEIRPNSQDEAFPQTVRWQYQLYLI